MLAYSDPNSRVGVFSSKITAHIWSFQASQTATAMSPVPKRISPGTASSGQQQAVRHAPIQLRANGGENGLTERFVDLSVANNKNKKKANVQDTPASSTFKLSADAPVFVPRSQLTPSAPAFVPAAFNTAAGEQTPSSQSNGTALHIASLTHSGH